MLSTPHVVIGLAIAKAFPNPAVSIPLSFCSHFVIEMIPHWNPHLNTEIRKYGKLTSQTIGVIIVDAILAVTLAIFLTLKLANDNYALFTMLASGAASIAPDILEVPYFFFHIKNRPLTWWLRLQKSIQSDAEPFWGITTQIVAIIFGLFILSSSL